MEQLITKIGFGGSCHWCTEAIFLSLRGVIDVEQGWITSTGTESSYSEAVIVSFDTTKISLSTLINIHLSTHSCTSNHTFRSKYRSAIYTFSGDQTEPARNTIIDLQAGYPDPIITQVLPYKDFKLNQQPYLNYYYKDPEKPFCRNFIDPKLRHLLHAFSKVTDTSKLGHLL